MNLFLEAGLGVGVTFASWALIYGAVIWYMARGLQGKQRLRRAVDLVRLDVIQSELVMTLAVKALEASVARRAAETRTAELQLQVDWFEAQYPADSKRFGL